MAASQPKIAIVGSGPGGLTLGALLHRRGVPFTIYELRPRPTEEELAEPSGMLDLHEGSGLAAMRACGLYEKFLTLTGDCEESMIISDKYGNILHTDVGDKANRPEIARHNITKLFLSILPEESIRYSTKLLSATRDPGSGKVTLELKSTLEHGATTSETYDLVIGADGAWSRVRPILNPVSPKSTGFYFIRMHIKNITTRYPHLATLVGKGTFVSLGNKHSVGSHRAPQDSSQLHVFLHAPGQGDAIEALSRLPIPELRDNLLSDQNRFGDFSPNLKELIAVGFNEAHKNGEALPIRKLCALPIGYRWEHTPGATLIGDAAHLTEPSGEGVNMAMLDALEFSEVVAKAWGEADGGGAEEFMTALSAPMRRFEDVMFARGEKKAVEARQMFGMMYSDDGAERLAGMMKSFYG